MIILIFFFFFLSFYVYYYSDIIVLVLPVISGFFSFLLNFKMSFKPKFLVSTIFNCYHVLFLISVLHIVISVKEKETVTTEVLEELDELDEEEDKKRHLNVVFIGHVGASTYLFWSGFHKDHRPISFLLSKLTDFAKLVFPYFS